MSFPAGLSKIVGFFDSLSEGERRENLIALADQAARYEPQAGEVFDFAEVRRDAECSDKVGVFLRVDDAGRATFRMSLGPEVQTLTRAMATILCKSLEGALLKDVENLSPDFVEKIVGSQLVRVRARSVFYILTRMKRACVEVRSGRKTSGATVPSTHKKLLRPGA